MELGLCTRRHGGMAIEISRVHRSMQQRLISHAPVVRAPMAPHEMQSLKNWGEMVSSNSQPTGTPELVISHSRERAMRRPLLMEKEPLMSGSLIRPFHPTVVRGSVNANEV